MGKTKIAFCLRDMQLGGVESVLIRTLEHLIADKQLDITLVTFVELTEPRWVDWFCAHKNVKRIVLYPSRTLGTRMPRFFLWRVVKHFARDVYRFWRRVFVVKSLLSGFDVFVDYHDFGFSRELTNVKNAKKIAWFHSSLKVFMKNRFINKLSGYDKVVVLTDAMCDDLKKLYLEKSDKFVRVYNPIDIKQVIEKSKEQNEIKGDYFCAVSRLSGDKDIITLLNGFDDFWVLNNKPDVKLVIVGDGDKTNFYKKYAHELKSKKQIFFVGSTSNPYVYMKYALAHILSSYGEGFGLVLVEAIVVDTLNIASDCKYGPREILLDGRGGLLFEPGDVRALAKHMTDVYNNTVDVKKMIAESTKALKRFDSKEIIKEIKSLIS